jgi:hypothetical protein
MLRRLLSVKARPTLILYTGPSCTLCEEALEALEACALDFDLLVKDIKGDPNLNRLYQYDIPVLTASDKMYASSSSSGPSSREQNYAREPVRK